MNYLNLFIKKLPTRTFEYVFNADKVNLQQAKEKVVNLLKTDPTGFYNANPAFFNRINGVLTAGDFETELNKPNFWQNSIFTFVSIVP